METHPLSRGRTGIACFFYRNHSSYHAGNYAKDFTIAPNLGGKKKKNPVLFSHRLFCYKHTKQNYHGNAAISPSYSPVQNFCKHRVEEANTLDHQQLFTASIRFSMYLPGSITSYKREWDITPQVLSSKTEVQINRHASDTTVLHCKRGYVIQ